MEPIEMVREYRRYSELDLLRAECYPEGLRRKFWLWRARVNKKIAQEYAEGRR